MIEVTDKKNCSGCTACVSICSHNAITMEADALGFLYPKVDVTNCVDCGLCDRVCSFTQPPTRQSQYPESFLIKHVDKREVLKSKSGAAFVLLSDSILKRNGIIYGVKFNETHLVEHAEAYSGDERDEFRGSKYIQSDLRNVFPKIKAQLLAGNTVLFSGTPCQVAGLKSYIGPKLRTNLYLVDILCHGVASPAIWKDYLTNIESRKGQKIKRCITRNPKFGWYNNFDTFIFDDNSQYNSDYFTGYIYHKWITQRWSCGACPFTSLNRISDITLGDAWGAGRVAPEFDKDNLGCSLLLINTEKGKRLFESSRENMLSMQVNISELMQPVLSHPTALHFKRQNFEEDYIKHGFGYVRLLYLNDFFAKIKSATIDSLIKIKHKLFR